MVVGELSLAVCMHCCCCIALSISGGIGCSSVSHLVWCVTFVPVQAGWLAGCAEQDCRSTWLVAACCWPPALTARVLLCCTAGYIKLWNGGPNSDPWPYSDDTGMLLDTFGEYWNKNMQVGSALDMRG